MNKIKTIIIHLLGGVTEQELRGGRAISFVNGRRVEATVIQCAMRDLNGLPAEEWCKRVWDGINKLKRANK